MKQEQHCKDCKWWIERKGDACLPRALAFVFSGINPTAKIVYDKSFTPDCELWIGGKGATKCIRLLYKEWLDNERR